MPDLTAHRSDQGVGDGLHLGIDFIVTERALRGPAAGGSRRSDDDEAGAKRGFMGGSLSPPDRGSLKVVETPRCETVMSMETAFQAVEHLSNTEFAERVGDAKMKQDDARTDLDRLLVKCETQLKTMRTRCDRAKALIREVEAEEPPVPRPALPSFPRPNGVSAAICGADVGQMHVECGCHARQLPQSNAGSCRPHRKRPRHPSSTHSARPPPHCVEHPKVRPAIHGEMLFFRPNFSPS